MPGDGYKTLRDDASTKALVIPQPSGSGGHHPSLREVNVQKPRSRAPRRRSLRENDDTALILDEEQSCHFSSSSSPSPERRSACHSPCLDVKPSVLCLPNDYLVFLDSSPESEENCEKTVIVPPHEVVLSPLSHEAPASASDFEPDLTWTGSPPQTPADALNATASSGPICRICHEGDQPESLVSLCKCSGTMGLLHVSCLERWLNAQNVDHCELCRQRFPTTAQSGVVRRFFHWALHAEARVQTAMLGDLFCFALLTPVAVLSGFLCVNNAARQTQQGHIWEAASLVSLAGLLLTAYIAWSFLTIRFHCRSFESWLSRNRTLRVIAPFAREATPAMGPRAVETRELADVVVRDVGGDSRMSSIQCQYGGGNSRQAPSEPLATTSPDDPPAEFQPPLYSLGPFASFVFW